MYLLRTRAEPTLTTDPRPPGGLAPGCQGCSRWLLTAALLFLAASPVLAVRDVHSLDGTWRFVTDPEEVGEQQRWFAPDQALPTIRRPGDAPEANGTIRVPGCWDAQGYGAETDKLRHNYVGRAWYRREVVIPRSWARRRVFLTIGGVHRSSRTWVNGHYLGEHIGYLSQFEYEVTPYLSTGERATIAIEVDSKQRWDVDALAGCFDIIDYMDIQWGGIWGHVALEARGEAWLEDMWVRTALPAACTVSGTLAGDTSGCDRLHLVVLDRDGRTVARRSAPLSGAQAGQTVAVITRVPGGRLWSVPRPYLYTARLSLFAGRREVDRASVRFGIRRIEVQGTRILLNGKRIFLNGYGDDAIYPETMAAPSDKETYRRRLRLVKRYGFTHVRHHSHFLPPEYYDVCDELGLLVSAEFPIAYSSFYERAAGSSAALELYRHEWAAAIKRYRNHPSILDWCGGNEFWDGHPLRYDFQRIARSLDPDRLFVDTDGLMTASGWVEAGRDRDTLDLFFYMFHVFDTPLDRPDKFMFDRAVKPVISHETGNYITFPRLDQIRLFRHNVKPFWLLHARQVLERQGLLHEAPLWARNSERLYYLSHKSNLEALRKNPRMSGHHWWLFQDYWTTHNGLVDTYFRPKSIRPEEVRRINSDVVLLQDGLQLTYRGGDPLRLRLLVSNFSPSALTGGSVTWSLKGGGGWRRGATARSRTVGQGDVSEVATLALVLPNVPSPRRLTLSGRFVAGGRTVFNEWTTWLYPSRVPAPRLSVPLFADAELLPVLGIEGARPLSNRAAPEAPGVYVTRAPSRGVVDAAARGGCLVILSPQPLLPAATTRFKTAWWCGGAVGPNDTNVGTVVYPNLVTKEMAPEGWCDAGWYRLLEGAQGVLREELPARPRVLIRGIEDPHTGRDKAFLCEARLGKGSVIISGLNHQRARGTPENEWLLARLIAYAGSLPRPAVALPPDYLMQRVLDVSPPQGPYLSGFVRVTRCEGEEGIWPSYRADDAHGYYCRQTRPGNLVEWETAPVPGSGSEPTVAFLFAGGLGYREEPDRGGFTLLVNGRPALHFDLAREDRTWKSADGVITLRFLPRRLLTSDAVGFFVVQIPRATLPAGKPVTLGVMSRGEGSRRWFALHPYTDLVEPGP